MPVDPEEVLKMKINPTAAYQAYNKISGYGRASRRMDTAAEVQTAQQPGKTDRIQISPEASRQLEVEQLSRSILAEIKEPASPERLEGLRSAIQKGEYNVPTDQLVDAVMRHLVA